jgi:hypothetical protein
MDYGYGERADKTQKGRGYFGEIKRPDGSVMTEVSIGVGINGKEVEIPLIVPTLSKKEIEYLKNADIESKKFFDEMPKGLLEKAYDHAVMRIKQGQSPFASDEEMQGAD